MNREYLAEHVFREDELYYYVLDKNGIAKFSKIWYWA